MTLDPRNSVRCETLPDSGYIRVLLLGTLFIDPPPPSLPLLNLTLHEPPTDTHPKLQTNKLQPLVNEMTSRTSHGDSSLRLLTTRFHLLFPPSFPLSVSFCFDINQLDDERARVPMRGHTRSEFKGKNWTLTQTHTNRLWYPNMSVWNTNTLHVMCVWEDLIV